MNLTDNHKKFLLVFGGGFLLFLLFKPKRKKITAETNLNFSDSGLATLSASNSDAKLNLLI